MPLRPSFSGFAASIPTKEPLVFTTALQSLAFTFHPPAALRGEDSLCRCIAFAPLSTISCQRSRVSMWRIPTLLPGLVSSLTTTNLLDGSNSAEF